MFAVAQSRSTGLIVTINAAFLQEIKEANSQVWESLYFLRLMARERYIGQQNMHQWVQKLTEFRRQLSTEFALEETYGYIPGAHHQHIAMGIDPAVALKQHKELYLHLLDVCEQVEESQYVGTIGRDFRSHTAAFQEFDASLSEHERIESEMIRCGLGLKKHPK